MIGNIRELKIADFPVHDTPLVGRTIGELNLEEAAGVHMIAVWKRGRLLPASPDIVLSRESVALVAGTADQMRADDSRRRNRAVSVLVRRSLAGQTLKESKLTTRTELCVIAMQQNGRIVTNPPPSTQLAEGTELYIMGGTRGREVFIQACGRETKR